MIVVGKNVVVAEREAKEETESGIILSSPDTMTSGHKPAIVIGAGAECKYVKVGQFVYLDWKGVLPIEIDGDKLGVCPEENIKVIIQ